MYQIIFGDFLIVFTCIALVWFGMVTTESNHSQCILNSTVITAQLSLKEEGEICYQVVFTLICPLITVIMLIPSQHQRQVILFDPVWPLSNACHWLFSYVYIMGLEESLWIFMLHYNRMLSMKWNTALLEDCLPWDTNLNLHIAHCIQIIVLYASTCRTHPSISWSSWNIKIPSKVDIFFLSVMLPI